MKKFKLSKFNILVLAIGLIYMSAGVIGLIKSTNNENEEIVFEELSNDEKVTLLDQNNDGNISINEAEEAGYSLPIYKEDWIYDYMIDADQDGIID